VLGVCLNVLVCSFSSCFYHLLGYLRLSAGDCRCLITNNLKLLCRILLNLSVWVGCWYFCSSWLGFSWLLRLNLLHRSCCLVHMVDMGHVFDMMMVMQSLPISGLEHMQVCLVPVVLMMAFFVAFGFTVELSNL